MELLNVKVKKVHIRMHRERNSRLHFYKICIRTYFTGIDYDYATTLWSLKVDKYH